MHELAFLDGGNDSAFTLASGRQSRWFFDTKPVMMHPEAASIMGRLLNMRINALGSATRWGLELGAVPLTALVIASPEADANPRGSWSESLRKAEEVERRTIHQELRERLEGGGKVVIVEDVTTTGGSSILAVERIHQDTAVKSLLSSAFSTARRVLMRPLLKRVSRSSHLLTRSDIVAL